MSSYLFFFFKEGVLQEYISVIIFNVTFFEVETHEFQDRWRNQPVMDLDMGFVSPNIHLHTALTSPGSSSSSKIFPPARICIFFFLGSVLLFGILFFSGPQFSNQKSRCRSTMPSQPPIWCFGLMSVYQVADSGCTTFV